MSDALPVVLFIVTAVGIISVLLGTSAPSKKILWIFSFLLLPVIGVILYFLIGISANGRRTEKA